MLAFLTPPWIVQLLQVMTFEPCETLTNDEALGERREVTELPTQLPQWFAAGTLAIVTSSMSPSLTTLEQRTTSLPYGASKLSLNIGCTCIIHACT